MRLTHLGIHLLFALGCGVTTITKPDVVSSSTWYSRIDASDETRVTFDDTDTSDPRLFELPFKAASAALAALAASAAVAALAALAVLSLNPEPHDVSMAEATDPVAALAQMGHPCPCKVMCSCASNYCCKKQTMLAKKRQVAAKEVEAGSDEVAHAAAAVAATLPSLKASDVRRALLGDVSEGPSESSVPIEDTEDDDFRSTIPKLERFYEQLAAKAKLPEHPGNGASTSWVLSLARSYRRLSKDKRRRGRLRELLQAP